MSHTQAQIVATIGPASDNAETLKAMMEHHLDVVRLNFSHSDFPTRARQIELVRKVQEEVGRSVSILQDLSGPRISYEGGHGYDQNSVEVFTDEDRKSVLFGIEQGLEWAALSFVGTASDVEQCKDFIKKNGGKQKLIAKIERSRAMENLREIIAVADGVMVARGDLGNEVPLEKVPFVQDEIIREANRANKPVITATQMMLSMVNSPVPTRAEVTDVTHAILAGSDAVMLSEETAIGKYPVEVLKMMEKIVLETERQMVDRQPIRLFNLESMMTSK